ncbi:gram-negative bacteria-binding protein 3-like [Zeugodacus cucurbitae]|nr:gram-negative bacteria-binding protein 3-like [Zeugodacus cucurbitae]
MSRLRLIVVICYITTMALGIHTYKVPKAKIVVYYPKGFQVSIPDDEDITLFAFHGKLNEEMDGLEAGTWSRDITKAKNGRWRFHARDAKLRIGDTLYYWTYVLKDGLGYREDNGVFEVREYGNHTIDDVDETKHTQSGNDRSGGTGGSGSTNNVSGGAVDNNMIGSAATATNNSDTDPHGGGYITTMALDIHTYKVPKAKIVVYYPKGFQVSIPDDDGITLFAFHGKLNEEMDGLEAGTWSRDITKAKNGRWRFNARDAKLRIGDTLYYWTYVLKDGLGYREDNGVFEVREYANHTIDDVDETKHTQSGNDRSGGTGGSGSTNNVSGGGVDNNMIGSAATATNNGDTDPNVGGVGLIDVRIDNCKASPSYKNGLQQQCANQLIFVDNFSGTQLNKEQWTVEERFATKPDEEFVLYLNVSEVLQVKNGMVRIYPELTARHFAQHDHPLQIKHDIGSRCTGRANSEECVRDGSATNYLSIPPFIAAQFSTKGHFSFKYGRVEIRAKLPRANWVFPQLWLQPVNEKYGGVDYQSGQMRIAFSYVNDTQMQLFGGLIVNANSNWRWKKLCKFPNAHQHDLGNNFHLYSLIWTEQSISVAVDNVEYCNFNPDISGTLANLNEDDEELPNRDSLKKGSKLAPFDQEFYITLGYGIGGLNDFKEGLYGWQPEKPWKNADPHAMDTLLKEAETNFNQWLEFGELLIDYVKVYAI